jgi:hypothetical protein
LGSKKSIEGLVASLMFSRIVIRSLLAAKKLLMLSLIFEVLWRKIKCNK